MSFSNDQTVSLLMDLLEGSQEKGNTDFFVGEDLPSYMFVNYALLEMMKPNLDKAGIPYNEFECDLDKNSFVYKNVPSAKMILIPKEAMDKVASIEKGIRTKLQLMVYTKEDLAMTLYSLNNETKTNDGIYTIKNLSEYASKRAVHMLREYGHVAIYEPGVDRYEVSVMQKKEKMLKIAVIAALIEEATIDEDLKQSIVKSLQNKDLFNEICRNIHETKELEDSYYVISAKDPGKMVYIKGYDNNEEQGFEYIEKGDIKISHPFKPKDSFPDRLNLVCQLIPDAVVVSETDYITEYSKNAELAVQGYIADPDNKEAIKAAENLVNYIEKDKNTLYLPPRAIESGIIPEDVFNKINEALYDTEFEYESASVPIEVLVKHETGLDLSDIVNTFKERYLTKAGDEKDRIDREDQSYKDYGRQTPNISKSKDDEEV